jgi:hypothetical protein
MINVTKYESHASMSCDSRNAPAAFWLSGHVNKKDMSPPEGHVCSCEHKIVDLIKTGEYKTTKIEKGNYGWPTEYTRSYRLVENYKNTGRPAVIEHVKVSCGGSSLEKYTDELAINIGDAVHEGIVSIRNP